MKAHRDTGTVVEHLGELRKRIFISMGVLFAAFVLCLVFVSPLYHFLIRPLDGIRLAVLGPGEVVQTYFMIAFWTAFVLTLPVLMWQLWAFVRPALKPRESRAALRLLPASVLMFVGGVSFAYFVVLPVLLRVLVELARANFLVMFTAENYFHFMMNLLLPFGLVFEMPIVIMFLTELGIITPRTLTKVRKYAYMAIVVVASIVSPPELISHLSVTVPMILLYEASVAVSRISLRRRRARLDAGSAKGAGFEAAR
jgi:sec-independent protein translocase protein TatC